MADPVKRLNYFDHQFLRANDFNDEQNYHIRMRRLHNQLLHVWGVASGLDLTAPAGSKTVTVRQGVGIDSAGKELVLVADTPTVDLSGFANKSVYVTLSYNEQQSDPTTETGAAGNTRSIESPVIDVSPNPPADASLSLILGQAVIAADGTVSSTNPGTDPNRRRAAGVVGGDLSVKSLTIGDASISTDRWAHVRLGAPNRIDSDSGLRLGGNLGVGTDPSSVSADFGGAQGRIRVRQGSAGTAGLFFNEGAKGDRAFVGMADDNNVGFWGNAAGWGLVMNADTGHVGIGTMNPATGKLVIAGAPGALGLDLSSSDQYADLRVVRNTQNAADKDLYLQFGAAAGSKIHLYSNNTETMTINGGNVGIGTTTPTSALDVRGTVSVRGGGDLYFHRDDGFAGGASIVLDAPGGGTSDLTIQKTGGGTINGFHVNAATTTFVGGSVGVGVTPSDMVFDVGSRVRFRMGASPSAGVWLNQNAAGDRSFVGMSDNDHVGFWANQGGFWGVVMNCTNGFLGVGTTNPAFTLDVKSNGRIKLGLEGSGGGQLQLANNPNDNKVWLEAFNAAGNGSAAEMLLTGASGANLPQLTLNANTVIANGNALKPGGGSWGATSDAALKKNISPLAGALDKLLQLRGVTFEWKEPEKQGNLMGTQIGLVAQEVEQVFPEWIGATLDGFKTLSIRGFEALTIEAFRQIREEIAALSDAVARLQSKPIGSAKNKSPK